MAVLLSVLLFVFLMGAITVFGYRRYARPGRVLDQLGGAAVTTESPLLTGVVARPGKPSGSLHSLPPLGEDAPHMSPSTGWSLVPRKDSTCFSIDLSSCASESLTSSLTRRPSSRRA